MKLKTSGKITSLLGAAASCIFLLYFVVGETDGKSVGGWEEQSYKHIPRLKDAPALSPSFSSLLSIRTNEVASQRTFQDYLDAIIKNERHLKEQGASLKQNVRKRRTILFKIFLFFKFLAKEVLFFGKKIAKFG